MTASKIYMHRLSAFTLWAFSACVVILVLGGTSLSASAEPEQVTVWSYYTIPPFAPDENPGLSDELIALMNKRAGGRFHFSLEIMPRKRIEQHLALNDAGLVLFISPEWLTPPEGSNAVWSGPMFVDRNGLLFSGKMPVDYTGPESLFGMTMGGVVGRKYKGVDPLVESGRIIREDALSEELNVLKLAERRIDFMTAPESVLRYLVEKMDIADKVFFSSTPLFEYTRHILVNNTSPEVREFVLQFIHNLPVDPAWVMLKQRYQLR